MIYLGEENDVYC